MIVPALGAAYEAPLLTAGCKSSKLFTHPFGVAASCPSVVALAGTADTVRAPATTAIAVKPFNPALITPPPRPQIAPSVGAYLRTSVGVKRGACHVRQ